METFTKTQQQIIEITARISQIHSIQMSLYSRQVRDVETQDFKLMAFNNDMRECMPLETLTSELQLAQQELKLMLKARKSELDDEKSVPSMKINKNSKHHG